MSDRSADKQGTNPPRVDASFATLGQRNGIRDGIAALRKHAGGIDSPSSALSLDLMTGPSRWPLLTRPVRAIGIISP